MMKSMWRIGLKLKREFFEQETLVVAEQLLGKFLVCQLSGHRLEGMIVETEAYVGLDDKASHASRGETKRNKVMFGEAGRAYVYFTYGMHWLLNVVTGNRSYPAAVLIRAIEPEEEEKAEERKKRGSGPARLTKWMGIDGRFNGEDLVRSKRLWVEERGKKIKKNQVGEAKRVGVDYAGEWAKKPWRFYIKSNPFVS